MIPRILHQVWVGPDPMPEEFQNYRQSWRRHHPGWEMRLWTEENLPADLIRKEAYERLRTPAERADIIRVEVLLRFGGVYADTDLECLRPIDPLLEGVDFCMTYNKPNRVSNALIGASPGHPILERAIRELRPRDEYGLDKSATGPFFFNKLIRHYPDVTIFPPEYFHAFTPDERAYAVNHRARSAMVPDDARRALLKAERKLAEARERIEELERYAARRRWRKLASLFSAPFRRTLSK